MQLLELFAGTGSVGKIARTKGLKVYSLDNNPCFGCNLTMDILDFDPGAYPYIKPDIIWASPDCTSFSFASGGFHRDKEGRAKTVKAFLGDLFLEKTLKIIEFYVLKNPNLIFYIENPRGFMATSKILLSYEFRLKFRTYLITYCSYGGLYRKPTNIFTNDEKWKPKKRCGYKTKNGAGNKCHHIYCSHNGSTGISGLGRAGDIRRSIIPPLLIKDILKNVKI